MAGNTHWLIDKKYVVGFFAGAILVTITKELAKDIYKWVKSKVFKKETEPKVDSERQKLEQRLQALEKEVADQKKIIDTILPSNQPQQGNHTWIKAPALNENQYQVLRTKQRIRERACSVPNNRPSPIRLTQ